MDIRKPTTSRPEQKGDELDIKLQIEALIVDKAQARQSLLPEKPPDVKTVADSRRYSDIATYNVFLTPAPPPPPKIVEKPKP